MGMRVVRETICDICGQQADTTYRISRQRASRQVDLCTKHATPIEDALTHSKRAGRQARKREVLTMEEVERRRRK